MKKWDDPLGDIMLWSFGLCLASPILVGIFGAENVGKLAAAMLLPFAIGCGLIYLTFLLVNAIGLVNWFRDLFRPKRPWNKRR